jgi:hypothetical protein
VEKGLLSKVTDLSRKAWRSQVFTKWVFTKWGNNRSELTEAIVHYLLDKTILAEKALVESLVSTSRHALLHPLFDKSLVSPRGVTTWLPNWQEDLLRIDFDRTGLTQVCADTAPSVPPRIDGHFQPSGIEMNIAHQFKQIRISIAQYRFVAALKQGGQPCDGCRLTRWILKKAASLLAPLEQSRNWEILLKLSREESVSRRERRQTFSESDT